VIASGPRHVRRCVGGLRLTGTFGDHTIAVEGAAPARGAVHRGPFDSSSSPSSPMNTTGHAARGQYLSDDGLVVDFQNASTTTASRHRRRAPHARLRSSRRGACTSRAWPLRTDRAARLQGGETTADTERARRIAELLTAVGREGTTNLWGERWSKLGGQLHSTARRAQRLGTSECRIEPGRRTRASRRESIPWARGGFEVEPHGHRGAA